MIFMNIRSDSAAFKQHMWDVSMEGQWLKVYRLTIWCSDLTKLVEFISFFYTNVNTWSEIQIYYWFYAFAAFSTKP